MFKKDATKHKIGYNTHFFYWNVFPRREQNIIYQKCNIFLGNNVTPDYKWHWTFITIYSYELKSQ